MHPEVTSDKPGSCPKCGMRLVKEEEAVKMEHMKSEETSYTPLFVIIGLILLITLVLALKDYATGSFVWQSVMINFMAGFFLVFAGFKLLNIKGFAEGYSTYDLLAKKIFQYGYVYPFIELAFGLAYLARFQLSIVNIAVLVVMGFSGLGVIQSMRKKRKIQCACLGTIIKVPLGTVTLIEDFGMVVMALALLLIH